jgi:hypothetical protein
MELPRKAGSTGNGLEIGRDRHPSPEPLDARTGFTCARPQSGANTLGVYATR